MKKFGFTLIECLVVLAIVGVVAVITMPSIKHILPDKDKIIVLKYNKIIMDINNEIKNDKSLWQEENSDNPNQTGWSRHLPVNSYSKLIPNYLHIVDGTLDDTAPAVVFDTIDGISWNIYEYSSSGATITIDLNNDKKDDCTYNKTSCKNPGKFAFDVNSETLKISGADPLTTAFLANPDKLSNNDEDYKAASSDTKKYQSP